MVELLTVLAVVAVLIAVLLPVVATSRRQAQRTACLSNLRQLGHAFTMYAQDYDGAYFPVSTMSFSGNQTNGNLSTWGDLAQPYLGGHLPICPSRSLTHPQAETSALCGYALNASLSHKEENPAGFSYVGNGEEKVFTPSLVVALFDARAGIVASNHPDYSPYDPGVGIIVTIADKDSEISQEMGGAERHFGGGNYTFVDGHARWLRAKDITPACDDRRPCYFYRPAKR